MRKLQNIIALIDLSTTYFIWCTTRYMMRQTHVPRKVTKCTKLLVAQCSPEPALTSTDFRAPENLFFQPLEGQSLVWCLKRPFGIHELQELESTWDAVFTTLYTTMMTINPLWKHLVEDDATYMELKGLSDVWTSLH